MVNYGNTLHKSNRLRACDSYLIPSSVCNICGEYVSWICAKCNKMEDVTHSHTYCRISYAPKMIGIDSILFIYTFKECCADFSKRHRRVHIALFQKKGYNRIRRTLVSILVKLKTRSLNYRFDPIEEEIESITTAGYYPGSKSIWIDYC